MPLSLEILTMSDPSTIAKRVDEKLQKHRKEMGVCTYTLLSGELGCYTLLQPGEEAFTIADYQSLKNYRCEYIFADPEKEEYLNECRILCHSIKIECEFTHEEDLFQSLSAQEEQFVNLLLSLGFKPSEITILERLSCTVLTKHVSKCTKCLQLLPDQKHKFIGYILVGFYGIRKRI